MQLSPFLTPLACVVIRRFLRSRCSSHHSTALHVHCTADMHCTSEQPALSYSVCATKRLLVEAWISGSQKWAVAHQRGYDCRALDGAGLNQSVYLHCLAWPSRVISKIATHHVFNHCCKEYCRSWSRISRKVNCFNFSRWHIFILAWPLH